MLSSKNFIYGFTVAPDNYDEEGERESTVIDSNELAKRLIQKQEEEYKAKLLEEERQRRLAAMEESGEQIPEGMNVDEFLGLVDTISAEPQEEPVDMSEQTEAILNEAREEAERIIADANSQADEILSAAQLNADAMKNLARKDGEKKKKKKQLQMEREIIEMCLPVFEHVFNVELSGKKDVLYHLLDHCIMKIERTGQMQIKVSETNAEFIKGKKEEIQGKVGAEVGLDIIADPLLNDSQCIIETDGGIFDCSIDTELDNLIRQIRALS